MSTPNNTNVKIGLKWSMGLIILLILVLGLFSLVQMKLLTDITTKLYMHPFAVSSASLRIKEGITAMHRSMKDVALAQSKDEIQVAHAKVDAIGKQNLKDFVIIKERFLGDKKRVIEAENKFVGWSTIREEVIELMLAGDNQKAAAITKNKGAAYVADLYVSIDGFIDFAHNKADIFYSEAQATRDRTFVISSAVLVSCILLGWFLAYFITRALKDVITVLSSSSVQINATVTQQDRITSQQATSVNETNTTMEELGNSSRQSAEQAETAAAGAKRAMELVEEGMQQMEAMGFGMSNTKEKVEAIAKQILSLSEQTSQIGEITRTVADFANETKMLAMNAAVEAVRAGEQGKGFSVLSVEIRKLADESKRSAERINSLVDQIQKATNTTVMVTEEGTKTVDQGMAIAKRTATTFETLFDSVEGASKNAQQISLNIQQQAIAVKQTVEAMRSLNTGAKETSLGVSQVKSGIQTLNEAAQKLRNMV